MSALAERAWAAFEALCKLEDELDARYPNAPLDEHELSTLRQLGVRWTYDTHRKMCRAEDAHELAQRERVS